MFLGEKIFFIITPIIFFLKARNDHTYKKIVSKININFSIGNLIWEGQIYFLYTYFLFLIINFIFDKPFINKFSILLLALSCIFGLLKRKYKLYNSIEDIYEGCTYLMILFYIFNFHTAAWIISTSVCLTSISAGISKSQSQLWKFRGKGTGFIQYLTLPSVSRKFVRIWSSKIYKKNLFLRKAFNLITLITPWLQIISAISLLIGKVLDINLFINFGFFLQIFFIFLLYFISDLSWITSFYALLIYAVFIITIDFNNSQGVYSILAIALSFVFISIFALRVFFGEKKILKKFMKLSSKVSFNSVPFKMFTELHMSNLITHYFKYANKNKINLNAFEKNGLRSYSQNHNSRYTQALMYPLCDLCLLLSKEGNNIFFKSEQHKIQCFTIFKYLNSGYIEFFQHSFSYKNFNYMTKKIGILKFNKTKDSIEFNFTKIKTPLETSRL